MLVTYNKAARIALVQCDDGAWAALAFEELIRVGAAKAASESIVLHRGLMFGHDTDDLTVSVDGIVVLRVPMIVPEPVREPADDPFEVAV